MTESAPVNDARWKYQVLGVVATIVVVLDQVVKRWVVSHFDGVEGASQTIIPGTFDLILTYNPGAAWGVLGNVKPEALRIGLFVLISISAVVMVVYLTRRARNDQKLLVWSLALVLGGAIGNLIDRIFIGKVIDYLDFYTHASWFSALMEKISGEGCHATWGCHWPAFNVADIAISVGVAALVLEGFVTKKRPSEATEPAP